jgi:hypothetical protein
MNEKPGGRDGGEVNIRAFHDWSVERDRAGDWADYVHRGQLNRSEAARECAFALSCFRSNPGLRSALQALEVRLREAGILPSPIANHDVSDSVDSRSETSTVSRIVKVNQQANQRIKVLEEQNAALKAEVLDLREKLRRFEHLDSHLSKTGRLLYP